MAAIINAVSGGAGGLQSKGDASGALNIQTASTTAIAIDASQNVTFTNAPTSATIKSAAVNTPTVFQDSAGTQIGTLCRAWANFDGSASTPITPRASFNISSVTRITTGQYTVTFSVAMPDANYSVVVGANGQGGALISAMANTAGYIPSAPLTGSFGLLTGTTTGGTNCTYITAAVFR